MMMTHGQQPNAKDVAPDQKNAILYARMSIGETDLMGSDVPSERFQPMRSVYLSLSVNSIDEAERIFALLSDGAEIFMPMVLAPGTRILSTPSTNLLASWRSQRSPMKRSLC